MGRIKQQVDFDWTGADASYRRAVELEPGNPDSVRLPLPRQPISAALTKLFN